MDIKEWAIRGQWRGLETIARQMVSHAEQRCNGAQMKPLLGGATRLMIALHHRVSTNLDLIIRDPQWLGYLSPRLSDQFAAHIRSFEETGEAIKFQCEQGQITFIVRQNLLGDAPIESPESLFKLESIDEVIAKKLLFRGALLTGRDLLDWKAVADVSRTFNDKIITARILNRVRLEALLARLTTIAADPLAERQWLAIRPAPALKLRDAADWATEIAPKLLSPIRSTDRI